MKRKIMGPCWLQIKQPHVEFKGVCPLENEAMLLFKSRLGFLVQVRSNRGGPKRYQSFPGSGSERAERHTSPNNC